MSATKFHETIQPFGAELLTVTPDDNQRLGALACIKSSSTQVDDSIVQTPSGNDYHMGFDAAQFDRTLAEIPSLN